MRAPGERRLFATTRWSLVLAAGDHHRSADAHEALTSLCEIYWYPLYAFLRARGHDRADAEDLTQDFFAMLLQKQVIGRADPSRGRFRSFLLKSLQNFAANAHDQTTARKRGGGVATISLQFAAAEGRFSLEPATDESPERTFDRRWALTLIERVLSRLSAASHRPEQFQALKPYLTGDEPQLSYAQTAKALGLSEGAVKVAVHRLRAKFREIVREEIAQTVSSPADIDDELRYLWSSVAR